MRKFLSFLIAPEMYPSSQMIYTFDNKIVNALSWDFVDETANGTDDIWWILEGQDYPRLRWELIPEN